MYAVSHGQIAYRPICSENGTVIMIVKIDDQEELSWSIVSFIFNATLDLIDHDDVRGCSTFKNYFNRRQYRLKRSAEHKRDVNISGVTTLIPMKFPLKKYYGQIKAVDGITFQVKEGEVFGLLVRTGRQDTT